MMLLLLLFPFCVLVSGQDYNVPVSPVISTSRNPLLSGYNYPYYNSPGAAVPILSYSDNRGIDGSYSYSYASADGKEVQETGFLKDAYVDNVGNPQGTQVKEGGFSYTSPEGIPIQLNYVADEYGFRPSGFRIPADGKGVVPSVVNGPLNYGNRYNNYGRFNGYRPYDSRYPYDPAKYPVHDPNTQFRYHDRTFQEIPKKIAE